MVKEFILEENQSQAFKDKYTLRFRVEKNKEGYFFIDGDDKKFGPYDKAFVDAAQMDIFVCGFKDGEADVFRCAFSSLEKDTIRAVSFDMAKTIAQLRIDREEKSFVGCKFLGSVYYYQLIREKRGSDFFAKRDGYRRQLIHDKDKHIFQTQEGQVFCVDPDNVLPFEEYQLFDSFEELQINENMKGFDFANLHDHNNHLTAFLNTIKFGRKLPNKWCLFLLDTLKNGIGFEEYKNLSEPVLVNFQQHRLFLIEELIDAIKGADLTLLEEYVKELGGECSKQPIIPAAVKEIESLMKTLPSFVRFYTVDIDYKDKHISVRVPDDEKILEALNNPNLYDWQGANKFNEEKPEGYERVKILQELRCREFLPTRHLLDPIDELFSE